MGNGFKSIKLEAFMPVCQACLGAERPSDLCDTCAKNLKIIARETELIMDLYPKEEWDTQFRKLSNEFGGALSANG